MGIVYSKEPFSLSQQVAKLEDKGLLVGDREKAEHFLQNVSYYRLRAYTYPLQDNSENGTRKFVHKDIKFEDIEALYLFDRDLRSLVFNAIARIEIALRARMTQIFSASTGSGHWFLDKGLYSSDSTKLIDSMASDVDRSKEEFIKHYKHKYTTPFLPPSWMTLEVVSFGTLSRLYQSLIKSVEKRDLAHSFGIKDVEVFENWLHSILNLRNHCAHHGRIWNRRFSKEIILPYDTFRPFINKKTASTIKRNKIFPLLSAIKFLLDSIDKENSFKDDLLCLLSRELRLRSLKEMGFPENWLAFPVWE